MFSHLNVVSNAWKQMPVQVNYSDPKIPRFNSNPAHWPAWKEWQTTAFHSKRIGHLLMSASSSSLMDVPDMIIPVDLKEKMAIEILRQKNRDAAARLLLQPPLPPCPPPPPPSPDPYQPAPPPDIPYVPRWSILSNADKAHNLEVSKFNYKESDKYETALSLTFLCPGSFFAQMHDDVYKMCER
jgi:hypothetical protein